MSKLYVLSGLGVDNRVFDTFEFKNTNMVFISWITPLQNDTLPSYAARIAEQIKEDYFMLMGLSFGGMVAVEIAKIRHVKKVILLASAKGRKELPPLYAFIGKYKLHQWMPTFLLKRCNGITYWFFGVQTKEDKYLLKEILSDTDCTFLTWAIDAILNWKNEEFPSNLIHIHGNKDRILPCKYIAYDYLIVGGSHFMTVNFSREIECILEKHL